MPLLTQHVLSRPPTRLGRSMVCAFLLCVLTAAVVAAQVAPPTLNVLQSSNGQTTLSVNGHDWLATPGPMIYGTSGWTNLVCPSSTNSQGRDEWGEFVADNYACNKGINITVTQYALTQPASSSPFAVTFGMTFSQAVELGNQTYLEVGTAWPAWANQSMDATGHLGVSMLSGVQLCSYTKNGEPCGVVATMSDILGGQQPWPSNRDGGSAFAVFEMEQEPTSSDSPVLVISSSSSFMATGVAATPLAGGLFASGVTGSMTSIPAGFSYEFAVVLGTSGPGVTAAIADWGKLMRLRFDKPNYLEADAIALTPSIGRLSFYTDNGAWYYYNPNTSSFAETLVELSEHFAKVSLPVQQFQLDSWAYYKYGEKGGELLWAPPPSVAPDGWGPVWKATSKELIVHMRYFDPDAIQNYGDYEFWPAGPNTMAGRPCILPKERRFWSDLFSNATTWGLMTAEQDWLDAQYYCVEAITTNVDAGRNWMMDMSAGAVDAGIDLQLCMATPRFMMQSLEMPAVTHMRASSDYSPAPNNTRYEQWRIGMSSPWVSALGIAAWKDDTWTSAGLEPGSPFGNTAAEDGPALQLAVSTLSMGPVGPSDRLSFEDTALIMRTCDTNGRILKPSMPLAVFDGYYTARAYGGSSSAQAVEFYSSATHLMGLWWAQMILGESYSFPSFSITPDQVSPRSYNGRSVFVTGDGGLSVGAVVWAQFAQGAAIPNPVDTAFLWSNDSTLAVPANTTKATFALWHSAPVLANSGMALLGEVAKFVPVSPQRFVSITDWGSGVSAVLSGGPGETVTITAVSHATSTPGSAKGATVSCQLSTTGTGQVWAATDGSAGCGPVPWR